MRTLYMLKFYFNYPHKKVGKRISSFKHVFLQPILLYSFTLSQHKTTQQTLKCSNSTIETLGNGVKQVQN